MEGEEDEENEEEDDESTGRGRGAPPSYGELSSHFGILERAAQDCGNADAALYLPKARMAMIAAYANKRCLLYTSPSPRDLSTSRMPSSA